MKNVLFSAIILGKEKSIIEVYFVAELNSGGNGKQQNLYVVLVFRRKSLKTFLL